MIMAKAKTAKPDAAAETPAVETPPESDRTIRLRAKIEKLLIHRERAKTQYGKAGTLLNELVREMEPGETVVLSDGRQATMRDAFARQNYCYRNTSFTRCDVEVTG